MRHCCRPVFSGMKERPEFVHGEPAVDYRWFTKTFPTGVLLVGAGRQNKLCSWRGKDWLRLVEKQQPNATTRQPRLCQREGNIHQPFR